MPVPPDYRLVFEDTFDRGVLDLEKWSYRHVGVERNAFNAPEAVSVENGRLVIRQSYRDGRFGRGWYCGEIKANRKFLRGFFEIRCICSEAVHRCERSFWSAFWIQADHPYEPDCSRGGPGGAEIDIMECFRTPDGLVPEVETTIHCAGMRHSAAAPGELDSLHLYKKQIPDACRAFHTYALDWTETEYRFFYDDELVAVTSWGDGVSQVPEDLVLSLCPPLEPCPDPTDYETCFIVDSVRVWQK